MTSDERDAQADANDFSMGVTRDQALDRAPQSIAAAVKAAIEQEPIREDELLRVSAERQAVESLARQLKAANETLATHEAEIVARLARGARVVATSFTARIGSEPGRCSPKWKEEYLGHMAEHHDKDRTVEEAVMRAKYPPQEKKFLVVEIVPPKVD